VAVNSGSFPSISGAVAVSLHSGIREVANEATQTPHAIRLDVGQPDFRTPEHISQAAKIAIDQGFTFYTATAGLLSLREALSSKLLRVNSVRAGAESITVGPGGVGVVAAAFAAILEPGDEVLLPDPGWPNYRMMLSWANGRPLYYRCPREMRFQPDLEHLLALVTPRTKILVVNSPNNPTGAVYPRPTLEALGEFAQRNNLWLLSDECYDQILLDGSHDSIGSFLDDGRVITVCTFSKTYSMTGWRVGYGAGDAKLIDNMVKVLESNSSCVSTVSQKAAEAALAGPQNCIKDMVDAYRRRRDIVVELLSEAGLLLSVPEGAFYIMADVAPKGMPARDFAFALLRQKGVSVAPGSAFGQQELGAVRISLASSDLDLREGVSRLCEFVRND
jgi:aspartate aminotransferase